MNVLTSLTELDALNSPLQNSVSIYVPSTISINQHFENTETVQDILMEMSQIFGGCTATESAGCWATKNKGLVTESITICKSFCDDSVLKGNLNLIIEICKGLCNDLKQEAVSLEVNGNLYFVTG